MKGDRDARELILKRRTANILAHQRKRAKQAAVELDYGLAELRALVAEALVGGLCATCCRGMTEATFEIDHAIPTSRGGRHCLGNLRVLCKTCNVVKGKLTLDEFQAFLGFLRTISPAGGEDLLKRLRAGGAKLGERYRGKRGWFQ